MLSFKNLEELKARLRTQDKCLQYFENIRWGDQKGCPQCGSIRFSVLKKAYQYRCKDCRKHFNVLTKTIFENTKIKLTKWFTAIYLLTTNKKGINSHQLSRDIGVTQKTAWFVLHRGRIMFNINLETQLKGHVEVDETFIGANQAWRHERKKKRSKSGQVVNDKIPVIGLMERGGRVTAYVLPNTTGLTNIVKEVVKPWSTVSTDTLNSYVSLREQYYHVTINHKVNQFVSGIASTNCIENFWSHLKRGLSGLYHHASVKHLQAYVNEFSLRFNTRGLSTSERIDYVLKNMDGRLKYKDLIAA